MEIPGQLNREERRLIASAIIQAETKPQVALEVGTWLGGGSTVTILRALQQNQLGHLWGIEADRSIYNQMLDNIRSAAPEATTRFTPLFGLSQKVIPEWIAEQDRQFQIDFVFLDGGNNPMEQITEFKLLADRIPVGGQLLAHDAKMRKGKWLVPYISQLDNWVAQLHEVSEYGLLHARKIASQPSPTSRRVASARLFKMRCHPIEVAAAVLPSSICGFVLRLLPERLAWRLSDGVK